MRFKRACNLPNLRCQLPHPCSFKPSYTFCESTATAHFLSPPASAAYVGPLSKRSHLTKRSSKPSTRSLCFCNVHWKVCCSRRSSVSLFKSCSLFSEICRSIPAILLEIAQTDRFNASELPNSCCKLPTWLLHSETRCCRSAKCSLRWVPCRANSFRSTSTWAVCWADTVRRSSSTFECLSNFTLACSSFIQTLPDKDVTSFCTDSNLSDKAASRISADLTASSIEYLKVGTSLLICSQPPRRAFKCFIWATFAATSFDISASWCSKAAKDRDTSPDKKSTIKCWMPKHALQLNKYQQVHQHNIHALEAMIRYDVQAWHDLGTALLWVGFVKGHILSLIWFHSRDLFFQHVETANQQAAFLAQFSVSSDRWHGKDGVHVTLLPKHG